MQKRLIYIALASMLLIGACAAAVVDLWLYGHRPAAENAAEMTILVKPGQPFKATTRLLHQKGLIQSPARFNLLARLKGYDKKLQTGEYLLSQSMSPYEILQKLINGDVRLYRLTIPEGYNLHQIAELVAQVHFVSKSDFIKTATDTAFVRQKGIPADTFEGYLFPDTYFLPREATAHQLITTMVDRFWSVFKPEWIAHGQRHDFTVHQAVTLASIIEKETGDTSERSIISSVFHNRLRKKMRLESDPTVIYGIVNFNGNLTRKDLETMTPYNTYKISGLPAGPIANPGRASLEAALFPADTEYIYFVSKKDRTHHFSTNLEDHRQAVRKYQLRR